MPGTDAVALRITATISAVAAAAIGVPTTLAVWSDVVDDAAILLSCPRASVDTLAQRLQILEQGWFAPQELGTLTVGPAPGAGGDYRFPAVLRYGLPALAVVLGALALADVIVNRRRRRTVAA